MRIVQQPVQPQRRIRAGTVPAPGLLGEQPVARRWPFAEGDLHPDKSRGVRAGPNVAFLGKPLPRPGPSPTNRHRRKPWAILVKRSDNGPRESGAKLRV